MKITNLCSLTALLAIALTQTPAIARTEQPHRSSNSPQNALATVHEAKIQGTSLTRRYQVKNGRAMIGDMVIGSAALIQKYGIPNLSKVRTLSSATRIAASAASLTAPNGSVSNGVTSPATRWPNNTVYYTVDSKLNAAGRQALTDGLNLISSRTAMKFVARTTEANYIRYYPGDGCWSYVGMVGGQQDISLGSGCEYPEIAAHETMHAMGWQHEHQRADRDTYLTVYTANVTSGMEYNFDKIPATEAETYGAYDFASIMHYDAYAFSKNGKPTMVPVSSSIALDSFGSSKVLSAGDIAAINHFYPATTGTGTTTPFAATPSATSLNVASGKTATVPFTLTGTSAELAGTLNYSWTVSGTKNLLPNSGISVTNGTTKAVKNLVLTPKSGKTGTAKVVVTVKSNAAHTSTFTINLTVK